MNNLFNEDCLLALKKLDDNSIDTMVTDPPYALTSIVKRFGKEGSAKAKFVKDGSFQRLAGGFMGKVWDSSTPSVEIWKECLRVMKPGAFAFICMTPRQDSLAETIIRLSEAGFYMGYSSIYWTYSSGFPKAHNVGKKNKKMEGGYGGFQPKPAVEIIIVAMKPLTEKTFVAQSLKNGKGVTWMDDCRMPYSDTPKPFGNSTSGFPCWKTNEEYEVSPRGRFPANLLVSDDVLNDGKITKDAGIGGRGKHNRGEGYGFKATGEIDTKKPTTGGSYSRYFDLDKWLSTTYPFLICPKACKSEKNKGCDTVKNVHPTVKPIKLMSYLIVLGSREGDIVLDPFSGSGTTLVAAKMLGRKYIGCEMDKSYCEIIEARLESVKEEKEENEFFGTTT